MWFDAHSVVEHWANVDAIAEEDHRVAFSAGWVFEGLKPGHVLVVQSMDSGTNMDSVVAIPNEMVQEVTYVGRPVKPSRHWDQWKD